MVYGLVKRVGGKFFNYKHFVNLFPDARIYCELFVGGGSVCFNKKKVYDTVIINDIDARLMNAYRHVQQCGSTIDIDGIYTKEQFIPMITSDNPEDFIKQQKLSFQQPTMFDTTNKGIKNSTKHYTMLQKMLHNVTICNDDWCAVVDEYDSEDVFFYLDPPYENSNKTVKRTVVNNPNLIQTYGDIDLKKLIQKLHTIKGKFLMTLNDSENTRELCKDFSISTYTADYARSGKKQTELIIKNY
jgi:DNA adenine methylase